ncbi:MULTISPECIES: hypothetical protein [Haloarcula]|nr:hypothetical protein [Halomicroarcula sp. XH51]
MPATQQSSDHRERLHCPKARDRSGEVPARWLDWDALQEATREDLG